MSEPLPEGVDLADVRSHQITVQLMAETINAAASYMGAEPGTPEEAVAEQILNDLVEVIVGRADHRAGGIILAFASLVIDTAEPDAVQGWFDHQQERITEALA